MENAYNCPVFIPGKRHARESYRHFGLAPGVPNSHTKYVWKLLIFLPGVDSESLALFSDLTLIVSRPLVTSKGRKFERARGRRKTCGYKA